MSGMGDLFDSLDALQRAEQAEYEQEPPTPVEAGQQPPGDMWNQNNGSDHRDSSREAEVEVRPEDYVAMLDETQQILLEAGIDDILRPSEEPEVVAEQRRLVDNYSREVIARRYSTFSLASREREILVNDLVNDIVGLGPIDHLISDPTVSEVIVRGAGYTTVERGGRLTDSPCRWRSDDHVRAVAQRIVSRVGRKVDEADPMCDARLVDGSRVNVILPPVSLIGPIITIRKFQPKGYSLDDLVGFGALDDEMANFLIECVKARANILVSGSTGSGKTTLLKALSYQIPHEEYVVTIEDTDELRLKDVHPRVSPLEARPANSSGVGDVSIRKLLRNSLRMRPDRIVVGECRGSEALDMLQAMNTGHEGSLTTCHSNSVRDAVLSRVPTMAAMSDEVDLDSATLQAVGAIELGVQVTRDLDGRRYVTEIVQIEPTEDPLKPDIISLWSTNEDREWVLGDPPSGRLNKKIQAYRKRIAPPQAQEQEQPS